MRTVEFLVVYEMVGVVVYEVGKGLEYGSDSLEHGGDSLEHGGGIA